MEYAEEGHFDAQMITGPAVMPSLPTQPLPLADTLNAHARSEEEPIVHVIQVAEILKPSWFILWSKMQRVTSCQG
jgi:hypothetical protein